jgi:hypothetical protein
MSLHWLVGKENWSHEKSPELFQTCGLFFGLAGNLPGLSWLGPGAGWRDAAGRCF